MLRILIADDHAIVRRGLRQILAAESDITEIGEAHDVAATLDRLRQQPWDLLVLDIAMPGGGGLVALQTIKHEFPRLAILMLSMYSERQYAIRSFKAGALGYLTKESAPEELVVAIRKVLSGGKYISAALAEQLADALGGEPDQPPHAALSDRELQVLCLIASGQTPTEIAAELSLSVKTISTYRERILQKMSLSTNAELTYYAVRNHLIE